MDDSGIHEGRSEVGWIHGASDPGVKGSSRIYHHGSNPRNTRPGRSQPITENADHGMRKSESPRSYRVYGLTLKSRLSLACPLATGHALGEIELVEAAASFFEQVSREISPTRDSRPWFHYTRLANEAEYLRWRGLFEFIISADGRRIAYGSVRGTSWETFQTYLVGQVVSFALLKQGIESLHATVVEVHNHAVAFLGECGYGKSSLGAAFLHAGHRLLTDDLLVIKEQEERGQGFLAYPGPPRIKLYPHMTASLFGNQVASVPMNPRTRKRVFLLEPAQFSRVPVPLRAIYVLTPPSSRRRGSNRIAIRRLSQRRAMLHLIANAFNQMIVDPGRLSRQFIQAARVTKGIPIKSLSYPRSLAHLPAVLNEIHSDLAS